MIQTEIWKDETGNYFLCLTQDIDGEMIVVKRIHNQLANRLIVEGVPFNHDPGGELTETKL